MAMSDKIKKRYGNKPHLERDEESGEMTVKKADKDAGHEKEVKEGIDGEGYEDRHRQERRELKHKHIHEHLALHNKHENEHAHHKDGDKKELHERQETEHKDMQKQHASEFNQMHARHEKEIGGKEKAGEIDRIEKDMKE